MAPSVCPISSSRSACPIRGELIEDLFTDLGDTLFDRVGLAAHGWAVTTPYKDIAAAAAEMARPESPTGRGGQHPCPPRGRDGGRQHRCRRRRRLASSIGIDARGRTAVVQGTGGAGRGAAVGLYLAGADVFLPRPRCRAHPGVRRDARDRRPRTRRHAQEGRDPGQRHAARDPDRAMLRRSPTTRSTGPPRWSTWSMAPKRPRSSREPDAAGIPAADGKTVLAHQAFAQFAAFTTRMPPKEAMLKAIGR